MLRKWLQRLTCSHAPARRHRPSARPRLEVLEDRTAPAVHTWTGAVNNFWSVAGNWMGGSPLGDPLPVLVFPAAATRFTSVNNLSLDLIQGLTIHGSGYNILGNPIRLGASGITANNPTGANTIDLGIRAAGFRTVTVTQSAVTLNLTGVLFDSLGGTGMGLTKAGAGTLALSGNNSYSGGTRLYAGTLAIGSNTALGTDELILNGGTLRASTAVTLANPFTVADTDARFAGSQNLRLTGPGTLHFALHTSNMPGSTLFFTGRLSGPGGVVADGWGRVVLSNSANSYHGPTQISHGTLQTGAAGVIPNGSAVSVNDGGLLALESHAESIGSLSGNGTVSLGTVLDGPSLTVGGLNSSTTFSGSISGAGSLTKVGSGSLILSGSYDVGRTTVNGGTLDVRTAVQTGYFTNGGGNVLVRAAGSITVTNDYVQNAGRTTLNGGGIVAPLVDLQGGRLDGSGYVVGSLRNAAHIDVGGVGAAGSLSVFGSYTQTSTGVLNVQLIASQYDWLYVEGPATLAGTLNISLIGGYLPNPGDSFLPLYSTGPTSGTFDTINGLALGSGLALDPIYSANGLLLYTYVT